MTRFGYCMGLHGKRSHDTIKTHVLEGGKVMERIRGYRYRAYPNKAQREFFEKTFGCCRFVYNHYLEAKKNLWKEWRDTLSYSEMSRDLSKNLKKEKVWLKSANKKSSTF